MTLELFLSIGGFVGLLIAGAWALLKVVLSQLKRGLSERFAVLEAARAEASANWQATFERTVRDHEAEAKQWRRVESDLNALRIELPKEYVRREDHIRFETVINAKLDTLAARIDLLVERQRKLK